MKNNIFCLKRLYYLLRRQIFSNTQKYAIGFGAITGALLVITLLSGIGNPFFHISSLFPLYIIGYLLGGYVFSSSVFSELNSPQRSIHGLTLPVSKLERLVNGWSMSALVYPALAVIGMLFISLITLIVHGQQSVSNIVLVIFSRSTLNLIGIYIITQSVFLFGAIYFRKHNFFKTVGSLILVQIVLQIFAIVTLFALFGTTGPNFEIGEASLSPGFERFITATLFEIIKFVFYYILAPFFWLLTWFGIKEREV